MSGPHTPLRLLPAPAASRGCRGVLTTLALALALAALAPSAKAIPAPAGTQTGCLYDHLQHLQQSLVRLGHANPQIPLEEEALSAVEL
jgi:hypothetical protein